MGELLPAAADGGAIGGRSGGSSSSGGGSSCSSGGGGASNGGGTATAAAPEAGSGDDITSSLCATLSFSPPFVLYRPHCCRVISDAVPLFGYHKRNYILLAALGGSLAYVLLATLHIEPSGAALAAFLLFCAQLELATVDLLVEGTYARVGADGAAWAVGVRSGWRVCRARVLFDCVALGADPGCRVPRLLCGMAPCCLVMVLDATCWIVPLPTHARR